MMVIDKTPSDSGWECWRPLHHRLHLLLAAEVGAGGHRGVEPRSDRLHLQRYSGEKKKENFVSKEEENIEVLKYLCPYKIPTNFPQGKHKWWKTLKQCCQHCFVLNVGPAGWGSLSTVILINLLPEKVSITLICCQPRDQFSTLTELFSGLHINLRVRDTSKLIDRWTKDT